MGTHTARFLNEIMSGSGKRIDLNCVEVVPSWCACSEAKPVEGWATWYSGTTAGELDTHKKMQVLNERHTH